MSGDRADRGAPLLAARDLTVAYPLGGRRPPFVAVDDVELEIFDGEAVGLVGESGSGKSTLANAILGVAAPTRGTITFAGEDITSVSRQRRRELSREIQAVFQDPYGALNPARSIGQTLEEPLLSHTGLSRRERRRRVVEALERVGLPGAAADSYPGDFSGGQRQRVSIARALMPEPRLLICDEATSALDLSVQAQILNLLQSLREELGMAVLFITHDMAVVRRIASRVVVLYEGRVMESGTAPEICEAPMHPYTRRLVASAPSPDPVVQRRRRLPTSSADVFAVRDAGCPFRLRCPHAVEPCAAPIPVRREGTRTVRCVRHPVPADDSVPGTPAARPPRQGAARTEATPR